MDIRGAVAIVTGAAAGTGRAIATRLAADGASVVVADIDDRAGHRAAREIGPNVASPLDSGDARSQPARCDAGDAARARADAQTRRGRRGQHRAW